MPRYRLIMLAAMGLASLYMMHLLAMDYMRIQKIMQVAQRLSPAVANAARLLLRSKRDLSAKRILYTGSKTTTTTSRSLTTTQTSHLKLSKEDEMYLDNFKDNLKFNWDAILRMDILKCSQSLICQITAGATKNETIAENIEMVIRFSYHMAPDNVKNAYIKGLKYLNKPEKCYSDYPFCVYSAGTMINILKWFVRFVGDNES